MDIFLNIEEKVGFNPKYREEKVGHILKYLEEKVGYILKYIEEKIGYILKYLEEKVRYIPKEEKEVSWNFPFLMKINFLGPDGTNTLPFLLSIKDIEIIFYG